MEAFKKYLYQRKIRQGQAKIPGDYDINVKSAKKIGIIFDATQLETREKVISFRNYLKEKGYQVRLLGYVNEKIESISFPFDYFSLKEVKFNYVPDGDNVSVFISDTFDILINLDLHEILPLQYIAAVSNAKLKVGVPSEEHDYYDLMIETTHENKLQDFIREMQNTLNKID